MPLLCFTYALQSIDKNTISYAAVFGLREDLGLKGNEFSWTGAIFYLGYLVWEFPTSLFLQKFPINYFMSGTVSLLSMLQMKSTKRFRSLLGVLYSWLMEQCIPSQHWWQYERYLVLSKQLSTLEQCCCLVCTTCEANNLSAWEYGLAQQALGISLQESPVSASDISKHLYPHGVYSSSSGVLSPLLGGLYSSSVYPVHRCEPNSLHLMNEHVLWLESREMGRALRISISR